MLISEKQVMQLVKFVSFYVNDFYQEGTQYSARLLLDELLAQQSKELIKLAGDDVTLTPSGESLDEIKAATHQHGCVNKY